MTMRNCLASLILALWCSGGWFGADAAGGPLAILVRAYREGPTSARRAAIASYASSHSKEAPLAALALGIISYEQHNYTSAITLLQPVPFQLPAVADYASYYLAASRLEAGDPAPVAGDLAAVRREAMASPFAARATILEARAVAGTNPQAAIQLLLSRYGELPQPETDVNLGDFYVSAGQFREAAEAYQRVYYGYLNGDAAARAGAALAALKDRMGADYPQPSSTLSLRRAGLLLDAREYLKAKAEYAAIEGAPARVGMGAADFLRGTVNTAWPYLRDLSLPAGEADAQRLYYLAECARRRNDDTDLHDVLDRLTARYPKSPWRLRALTSAANRYVLANRPDDYVPLFRTVYLDFPASSGAAIAHWKVTFQAYLRGQSDAPALLREHLRDYSGHSASAGAALYFLGRSLEQARDFTGARACYQRILSAFENHYYAMLARARMQAPEIRDAVAGAGTSAETAKFLGGLRFTTAAPIPEKATAPTAARIERSRLLRAAGLADLADSEIRFGARRDGQPALLAIEMAESAGETHQGLRVMKSMNPDYLNLPLAGAPRKFWELLFPLPYKSDLVRSAEARDLDPYLLAGLIRQESEFNPAAVSRARAYGLTQVMPGTGRQFARRAGVTPFATRLLTQPGPNLKIGSSILKSMLDAQGGSLEQTLAGYNAGPSRVSDWLTWASYREPAEFVENIPFTETRDYVQAVMRNAEMYRRLYQR
jgi:peptidoglycan lytic transglycosylase